MSKTPQKKTEIKYKLTPEEMWTCLKGTQNWGIEGYEVPRKYIDYKQIIFKKRLETEVVGSRRPWPPKDWPKNKDSSDPVPPVRKNFVDAVIRWANSYNDEAKSKELYENLKPKGIFDPKKESAPVNKRQEFLEHEAKKEEAFKNLPKIQQWKEEGINKAKDKMETDEKAKITQTEKNKKRYTKERPQWSRCDRVSVVSDAEYVGENNPFYNTFKKEGEEIPVDSKTGKPKLFFPKDNLCRLTAPVWTFDNKNRLTGQNEQMKQRDALFQEKKTNYMSTKNIKEVDLNIDIDRAEKLILKRTKLPWSYPKPFEYMNTEQYKSAKEKHIDYSPGPTAYWKMKKGTVDCNKRPEAPDTYTLPNGKEAKLYYLNHQRNDIVITKPMRKTVF